MINGVGVDWSELQPLLAEAGGRAAIEEVVLDRALEVELGRAGLRVESEDIERERSLFRSTLAEAAGDADRGVRTEDALLARRGLGPVRVEALLRRNASLRLLAKDRVRVSESDIADMHRLVHGPTYVARMLFSNSARDASEALRAFEARAEQIGTLGAFIETAAARSTDASARVGGLVPRVSDGDRGYPSAVLSALRDMQPGQVRGPLALDDGFLLIYLEQKDPGTGRTLDEVRGEMERLATERAQRLAMNRIAQELLASARVTVFDASVRFAWEATGR